MVNLLCVLIFGVDGTCIGFIGCMATPQILEDLASKGAKTILDGYVAGSLVAFFELT